MHGGVAAACGKALVNDGWAICLLSAVCLTTLRGNKKFSTRCSGGEQMHSVYIRVLARPLVDCFASFG